MIIRFGLDLDRLLPEKPKSRFGFVSAGPGAFLLILETQLGLATPSVSHAQRLVQYRSYLESCDSAERFYHQSFHVDDLSVARTLLSWRDEWYMAGWNGTFQKGVGKRLNDMADVEKLCLKNCFYPSIGQRLQEVLAALKKRKTQIEKVELVDKLSDFPDLWQKILSFLPVREINSDTPSELKIDSDLNKLQQALRNLNLNSDTKPEKIKLKGDGTFIVLNARSREVSAKLLAEYLKSSKDKINPAVIAGQDGLLFDDALESFDQPRCGFEKISDCRPVLQVLPLAISLMWNPLDPYSLIQFLTHPVGPIPKRVRRRLADAVTDAPGIGGRPWQNAIGKIMEFEKIEMGADETQLKNLKEKIAFWLLNPRHDPERGAPISAIAERCDAVASWLNSMYWADKDSTDQNIYATALRCSKDLSEAINQLTSQGIGFINRNQLNRFLNEVIGRGEHLADKYPEVNHILATDSPAAIITKFDEIIWWDFAMPILPKAYPWTRSERAALRQNGVHLQSLDTKLSYLGETWLRPVMNCKKRIIFILHYSDEEHHPLWDQITACSDGWIELDAEELIQTGKNIPELNVKSLPLEPKPLSPIKRWWKLRNGDLLKKREMESYSSLDAFIKSPYQWVLRYKAKLKEGSLAALPTGNLLKGSLVHRLIEDFFAENKKWITMTDQNIIQWINKRIPLLLEQEGALLLVQGQTVEKEAFIETSKRAIVALVSNLKGAGIKTIDVECFGKCDFVGGEVGGFIDMLLTDKKKREIVLDVKWGGAKYRKKDLRENTQIQLATYAFIRKNITKAAKWPPQAFFVIENAQILAQTKDAFPSAILCLSKNGETTKELWSRIEETWKWRRNQMNKGMIEITVEGADPDDASVPPKNGLILEDHYNNFNDFAILTGWGEGA